MTNTLYVICWNVSKPAFDYFLFEAGDCLMLGGLRALVYVRAMRICCCAFVYVRTVRICCCALVYVRTVRICCCACWLLCSCLRESCEDTLFNYCEKLWLKSSLPPRKGLQIRKYCNEFNGGNDRNGDGFKLPYPCNLLLWFSFPLFLIKVLISKNQTVTKHTRQFQQWNC